MMTPVAKLTSLDETQHYLKPGSILEILDAIAMKSTGNEAANGLRKLNNNRDPDAGGLAFYTDLLDSGQKTLGSIALDILNGASGEDGVLLDEKLVVAAEFYDADPADYYHVPKGIAPQFLV